MALRSAGGGANLTCCNDEGTIAMDRYTRAVLTVIAGALCVLAAQNAGVGRAQAQSSDVQKVAICDVGGKICAQLVRTALGAPSLNALVVQDRN